MPVIINELTITVDAQPRENPDAARADVPTGQNEDTKALIRECIDAVMDTLRNRNER